PFADRIWTDRRLGASARVRARTGTSHAGAGRLVDRTGAGNLRNGAVVDAGPRQPGVGGRRRPGARRVLFAAGRVFQARAAGAGAGRVDSEVRRSRRGDAV